MIEAVVETITGALGLSGVQTGVVALLLAVGLYARRALGFGALVASGVRTVALVAVLLAVMLALGVVRVGDVGVLVMGAQTVVDALAGPVVDVVASWGIVVRRCRTSA